METQDRGRPVNLGGAKLFATSFRDACHSDRKRTPRKGEKRSSASVTVNGGTSEHSFSRKADEAKRSDLKNYGDKTERSEHSFSRKAEDAKRTDLKNYGDKTEKLGTVDSGGNCASEGNRALGDCGHLEKPVAPDLEKNLSKTSGGKCGKSGETAKSESWGEDVSDSVDRIEEKHREGGQRSSTCPEERSRQENNSSGRYCPSAEHKSGSDSRDNKSCRQQEVSEAEKVWSVTGKGNQRPGVELHTRSFPPKSGRWQKQLSGVSAEKAPTGHRGAENKSGVKESQKVHLEKGTGRNQKLPQTYQSGRSERKIGRSPPEKTAQRTEVTFGSRGREKWAKSNFERNKARKNSGEETRRSSSLIPGSYRDRKQSSHFSNFCGERRRASDQRHRRPDFGDNQFRKSPEKNWDDGQVRINKSKSTEGDQICNKLHEPEELWGEDTVVRTSDNLEAELSKDLEHLQVHAKPVEKESIACAENAKELSKAESKEATSRVTENKQKAQSEAKTDSKEATSRGTENKPKAQSEAKTESKEATSSRGTENKPKAQSEAKTDSKEATSRGTENKPKAQSEAKTESKEATSSRGTENKPKAQSEAKTESKEATSSRSTENKPKAQSEAKTESKEATSRGTENKPKAKTDSKEATSRRTENKPKAQSEAKTKSKEATSSRGTENKQKAQSEAKTESKEATSRGTENKPKAKTDSKEATSRRTENKPKAQSEAKTKSKEATSSRGTENKPKAQSEAKTESKEGTSSRGTENKLKAQSEAKTKSKEATSRSRSTENKQKAQPAAKSESKEATSRGTENKPKAKTDSKEATSRGTENKPKAQSEAKTESKEAISSRGTENKQKACAEKAKEQSGAKTESKEATPRGTENKSEACTDKLKKVTGPRAESKEGTVGRTEEKSKACSGTEKAKEKSGPGAESKEAPSRVTANKSKACIEKAKEQSGPRTEAKEGAGTAGGTEEKVKASTEKAKGPLGSRTEPKEGRVTKDGVKTETVKQLKPELKYRRHSSGSRHFRRRSDELKSGDQRNPQKSVQSVEEKAVEYRKENITKSTKKKKKKKKRKGSEESNFSSSSEPLNHSRQGSNRTVESRESPQTVSSLEHSKRDSHRSEESWESFKAVSSLEHSRRDSNPSEKSKEHCTASSPGPLKDHSRQGSNSSTGSKESRSAGTSPTYQPDTKKTDFPEKSSGSKTFNFGKRLNWDKHHSWEGRDVGEPLKEVEEKPERTEPKVKTLVENNLNQTSSESVDKNSVDSKSELKQTVQPDSQKSSGSKSAYRQRTRNDSNSSGSSSTSRDTSSFRKDDNKFQKHHSPRDIKRSANCRDRTSPQSKNLDIESSRKPKHDSGSETDCVSQSTSKTVVTQEKTVPEEAKLQDSKGSCSEAKQFESHSNTELSATKKVRRPLNRGRGKRTDIKQLLEQKPGLIDGESQFVREWTLRNSPQGLNRNFENSAEKSSPVRGPHAKVTRTPPKDTSAGLVTKSTSDICCRVKSEVSVTSLVELEKVESPNLTSSSTTWHTGLSDFRSPSPGFQSDILLERTSERDSRGSEEDYRSTVNKLSPSEKTWKSDQSNSVKSEKDFCRKSDRQEKQRSSEDFDLEKSSPPQDCEYSNRILQHCQRNWAYQEHWSLAPLQPVSNWDWYRRTQNRSEHSRKGRRIIKKKSTSRSSSSDTENIRQTSQSRQRRKKRSRKSSRHSEGSSGSPQSRHSLSSSHGKVSDRYIDLAEETERKLKLVEESGSPEKLKQEDHKEEVFSNSPTQKEDIDSHTLPLTSESLQQITGKEDSDSESIHRVHSWLQDNAFVTCHYTNVGKYQHTMESDDVDTQQQQETSLVDAAPAVKMERSDTAEMDLLDGNSTLVKIEPGETKDSEMTKTSLDQTTPVVKMEVPDQNEMEVLDVNANAVRVKLEENKDCGHLVVGCNRPAGSVKTSSTEVLPVVNVEGSDSNRILDSIANDVNTEPRKVTDCTHPDVSGSNANAIKVESSESERKDRELLIKTEALDSSNEVKLEPGETKDVELIQVKSEPQDPVAGADLEDGEIRECDDEVNEILSDLETKKVMGDSVSVEKLNDSTAEFDTAMHREEVKTPTSRCPSEASSDEFFKGEPTFKIPVATPPSSGKKRGNTNNKQKRKVSTNMGNQEKKVHRGGSRTPSPYGRGSYEEEFSPGYQSDGYMDNSPMYHPPRVPYRRGFLRQPFHSPHLGGRRFSSPESSSPERPGCPFPYVGRSPQRNFNTNQLSPQQQRMLMNACRLPPPPPPGFSDMGCDTGFNAIPPPPGFSDMTSGQPPPPGFSNMSSDRGLGRRQLFESSCGFRPRGAYHGSVQSLETDSICVVDFQRKDQSDQKRSYEDFTSDCIDPSFGGVKFGPEAASKCSLSPEEKAVEQLQVIGRGRSKTRLSPSENKNPPGSYKSSPSTSAARSRSAESCCIRPLLKQQMREDYGRSQSPACVDVRLGIESNVVLTSMLNSDKEGSMSSGGKKSPGTSSLGSWSNPPASSSDDSMSAIRICSQSSDLGFTFETNMDMLDAGSVEGQRYFVDDRGLVTESDDEKYFDAEMYSGSPGGGKSDTSAISLEEQPGFIGPRLPKSLQQAKNRKLSPFTFEKHQKARARLEKAKQESVPKMKVLKRGEQLQEGSMPWTKAEAESLDGSFEKLDGEIPVERQSAVRTSLSKRWSNVGEGKMLIGGNTTISLAQKMKLQREKAQGVANGSSQGSGDPGFGRRTEGDKRESTELSRVDWFDEGSPQRIPTIGSNSSQMTFSRIPTMASFNPWFSQYDDQTTNFGPSRGSNFGVTQESFPGLSSAGLGRALRLSLTQVPAKASLNVIGGSNLLHKYKSYEACKDKSKANMSFPWRRSTGSIQPNKDIGQKRKSWSSSMGQREGMFLPEPGSALIPETSLGQRSYSWESLTDLYETPGYNSAACSPARDWKLQYKNKLGNSEIPYVDSHCHIDFLYKRLNYHGSWQAFQSLYQETFMPNYNGCVTNFCDPGSFRPGGIWNQIINEDGVYSTFGCHPKSATDFTEEREEFLKYIIKHPNVVSLGEIGLDYAKGFDDTKELQKEVFIRQLKLAVQNSLPLVIHCRDAEEDCLAIMMEHVPPDYKIHRHCFTGHWHELEPWLEYYSNCYVGLTPLVTYKSAIPVHDVARRLPLNRLLLETDAPYFRPPYVPKDEMQYSNPGMAICVAHEVARLRGTEMDDVLLNARSNTMEMYGV